MSSETASLLPCPFCGSSQDELMLFCDSTEGADNSGSSRRIQCAGCNVEAPFYDTEAEAVAAWNRRDDASQSLRSQSGVSEAVAWEITDYAMNTGRHFFETLERAEYWRGMWQQRQTETVNIKPLYDRPAPTEITEEMVGRAAIGLFQFDYQKDRWDRFGSKDYHPEKYRAKARAALEAAMKEA